MKKRKAAQPQQSTVSQRTSDVVESSKTQTLGEQIPPLQRSELISRAEDRFCNLTGIRGKKIAARLVSHMHSFPVGDLDFNTRIDLALEWLSELEPAQAMEAALAVQMFGVHEAAVMFLRNALAQNQSPEDRHANVSGATKLMRLFIEQTEAMQKLKGKHGQQTVTVEHVHVNDGGQAIVGAVNMREKEPGENER